MSDTDRHSHHRRHARPALRQELRRIDAYWRAANYLAVGQIYLLDNPLLKEPLTPNTSSRACSATGAPRPGSTSSTRT